MSKTVIRSALKVTLAIILIWWIFSTGKMDLQGIRALLSIEFIGIGFLLALLNILILAERWRRILQSQGHAMSFLEVLRFTFIGLFFNFAMPGGVGGDLVKAFYVAKEYPPARVAAITSVLMDRLLGLFTMILMAVTVMLWDLQHVLNTQTLAQLFVLILFVFLAGVVFLFLVFTKNPAIQKMIYRFIAIAPLKSKLQKLYDSLHAYSQHPKMIFTNILLSLVGQTVAIFVMVLAGHTLGISDVPLSTYFLAVPLGFMAIAIPISPAGLGVGQAAFYALFNIYLNRETTLGSTVITAYQGFQILFALIGAGVYLMQKTNIHVTELDETLT